MTTNTPQLAPGSLEGRQILVGLTGGIACYKVCEVVSRLVQAGAGVSVLMTESATRFVGPMTFQALSGQPVYTTPWDHIESQDPQHVSHARAADLMVIAPCTMDTLARLATGRADDVVTLVCAAIDRQTTPVLLAPSMNAAMWAQPATQRNVRQLIEDGFEMIGPDEGWQACRTTGAGRMSEPATIIDVIATHLAKASS